MCFSQKAPAPVMVDPGNRASSAAADAIALRRKDAQGFASTLGGGTNASDRPSIGRQLLLGS